MATRIAWLATAFVCAASSLVCVSESRAAFGVVNMTFNGFTVGSDGLAGHVTYYDKETLSEVTTGNVGIGKLRWTVNSSTDPLVSVGSFITYCIELERTLAPPTDNFNVGLVRNAPDPGTSSPFPSGSIGLAREILLAKLYDIAYPSLSTTTDFAAFQLSVWELTHETTNTFNVSTGNGTFYLASGASALAVTEANAWLLALAGPPVTHILDVYALTSPTNQDQIFPVPAPPNTGVPEATAMATWGLILLSASVITRRTRQEVV
jgi:hypothetical protein